MGRYAASVFRRSLYAAHNEQQPTLRNRLSRTTDYSASSILARWICIGRLRKSDPVSVNQLAQHNPCDASRVIVCAHAIGCTDEARIYLQAFRSHASTCCSSTAGWHEIGLVGPED